MLRALIKKQRQMIQPLLYSNMVFCSSFISVSFLHNILIERINENIISQEGESRKCFKIVRLLLIVAVIAGDVVHNQHDLFYFIVINFLFILGTITPQVLVFVFILIYLLPFQIDLTILIISYTRSIVNYFIYFIQLWRIVLVWELRLLLFIS